MKCYANKLHRLPMHAVSQSNLLRYFLSKNAFAKTKITKSHETFEKSLGKTKIFAKIIFLKIHENHPIFARFAHFRETFAKIFVKKVLRKQKFSF
jgi:hypothetical protein